MGRLRLIWPGDVRRRQICDAGRMLATKCRNWPWLMGYSGGHDRKSETLVGLKLEALKREGTTEEIYKSRAAL